MNMLKSDCDFKGYLCRMRMSVGWKRRNQIFLLLEEKENGEWEGKCHFYDLVVLDKNRDLLFSPLWPNLTRHRKQASRQHRALTQSSGSHRHQQTKSNTLLCCQEKQTVYTHRAHCKPPLQKNFPGSVYLLIYDPQKQLLRKKKKNSLFWSIFLTFGFLDSSYLGELGPTYHKISCKSGAISR